MSLTSVHLNAPPRPWIKSQSVSAPQAGFDERVKPDTPPRGATWARQSLLKNDQMSLLASRVRGQSGPLLAPRVSYSVIAVILEREGRWGVGGGESRNGVYGVWMAGELVITLCSRHFPPVTHRNEAQERQLALRPPVASLRFCPLIRDLIRTRKHCEIWQRPT